MSLECGLLGVSERCKTVSHRESGDSLSSTFLSEKGLLRGLLGRRKLALRLGSRVCDCGDPLMVVVFRVW